MVSLNYKYEITNPDNIVINIEVFDVIKGIVVARVSGNSIIRRDRLFNEYGMKTARAKAEAARVAESLSKMLEALFADIKDSESLD